MTNNDNLFQFIHRLMNIFSVTNGLLYKLKKIPLDPNATTLINQLSQQIDQSSTLAKEYRESLEAQDELTHSTEEIYFLSYISKANSPEDQIRLSSRDILISSQKNNKANNITGFLLYRDGYYIQTLEGGKNEVYNTYGRICLDTRHGNLTILAEGVIPARYFPEWNNKFFYSEGKNEQDNVLSKIISERAEQHKSKRMSATEANSLINLLLYYKNH